MTFRIHTIGARLLLSTMIIGGSILLPSSALADHRWSPYYFMPTTIDYNSPYYQNSTTSNVPYRWYQNTTTGECHKIWRADGQELWYVPGSGGSYCDQYGYGNSYHDRTRYSDYWYDRAGVSSSWYDENRVDTYRFRPSNAWTGNIDARAGQTFSVTLPGTVSSDYRWEVSFDDDRLKLQSSNTDNWQTGYRGKQTFRFAALRSGSTQIVFRLMRPLQSDTVQQTRIYFVDVR